MAVLTSMRARFVTAFTAAILLLMLDCAQKAARADDAGSLELAVKATYLVKFEPFVTWPDQAFPSSASPFNLCIVGGAPFGALLDRAAEGQRVGDHPITVLRIPAITPDAHCQIAYLASSDPGAARQSLAAIASTPVLTITDSITDVAAKGIINFIVADDRVRFEIDDGAAKRNGLVISSKLLGIALSVKAGP